MARLTVGQQPRDIFLEYIEVNPTLAHQQLKSTPGFRGSYGHVLRLFYAARQIGLIQFACEEESSAPISKRYYKIVPECEDDGKPDGKPYGKRRGKP